MRSPLLIAFFLFVALSSKGQDQPRGHQAAVDKYTALIASNPSGAGLYYFQRGIAYYSGKDYKKAIDDMTMVSEGHLDQDTKIKAIYTRADCFEKLGEDFSANNDFLWVLKNLDESKKIDGVVSWENVLERKVASDKVLGMSFLTLSDLKTLAALKKDNQKIKNEINDLVNSDKVLAVMEVNAFRIVGEGISRKIMLSQEDFDFGDYASAISNLTIEVERAGPRTEEVLILRGFTYMGIANYKSASADFDEVVKKSTNYSFKGLAAFYASFVKEKMGEGGASLSAIKIAAGVFTSDKSLVPSTTVEKQLQAVDTPQNRASLAEGSVKSTETKTIQPEKDKIIEVATVKQDQPAKKEDQHVGKEEKPSGKTEALQTKGIEVPPADKKVVTAEPVDPIQKLNVAIKNEPANTANYFRRGVAYFLRGQFVEAKSDFLVVNKAPEVNLKNQSAYYLAQCCAKMGSMEEGIKYLSQLLGSLGEEKVVMNIGQDEILALRADWKLKTGHAIEAAMDCNKLLNRPNFAARAGKVLDSLKTVSPVYGLMNYDVYDFSKDKLTKRLTTSRQLYQDGMIDQAIEAAAADITSVPAESATALLVRGYLLLMSERYGIAEKDFAQCAVSPVINQRGLAQFYQSFCYQQLGQVDEAINSLTESMKIFTSNTSIVPDATLRLKRGELFEKQGFAEMAVADYQKYLESKPGDSKVRARSDALRKSMLSAAQPAVVKEERKAEVKPESVPSLRDSFKGEKRYALIIGNANYPKEIGMLANPVNDATDLKMQLEASDFEVELLTDATFRQVDIASRRFYDKLSNGPKNQTVGLFYYSGHGLQFEGENYMVPLDATVSVPGDIRYTCFPVNRVLTNMEYANARMNIIVLDACRSNALPVINRSTEAGLAQLRAAKGSYVAFSTAPGSTASDGSGRNGLYTQELLKALKKPQLTIEQVFKEVRKNVRDLSGGKQETWDNSNIVGEFYFKLE